MFTALFRTPLLRCIASLWWLPTVTFVLGWATLVAGRFYFLSLGFSALVAAVGGFALAATAIDRGLALREWRRHRREGHRFLCPECLHFGPFRFGCAICGEVPPLAAHVARICLGDGDHCPECRVREEKAILQPLEAYCPRCGNRVDLGGYHNRRVRVLGTLSRDDRHALYAALGVSNPPAEGGVSICDDGARLTYVMPLDDLIDAAQELSGRHALHAVEAIWLDGAQMEPLALGQVVDRFIRQSRLTDEERRAITICVRAESLPAPMEHLLATRFGAIRYGVDAKAMIEQGATGWGTAFLRQARLEYGLALLEENDRVEALYPPDSGEVRLGALTIRPHPENEEARQRQGSRRRAIPGR
jgi:hypothetical protein